MISRLGSIVIFLLLAFQGFSQQDPLLLNFASTGATTPGQPLEIEVRVSDFEELFGTQYFIKWDSTVMEVDSIPFISNQLFGFNQGSITLPIEDNNNPLKGKLRVSWSDGATTSLPDDTHLFTIRFNVVGTPCDTTTLTVGDIGTQQSQIIEVLDANFENIGATTPGLPVMIPGNNCNMVTIPDVAFDFTSVSGSTGDNICMPLRVTNFDSIVGFAGSIAWDPAVLSYTGIQSFGVPNFSIFDFDAMMSANGNISYTWMDQTGGAMSANIADGGAMFSVCFDVIGAQGSSTSVGLVDTPTAISIDRVPAPGTTNVVPIGFNVGTANFNVPLPTFDPVGLSFTSVTGMPGSSVCMPLTVTGFEDIVTFAGSINWDPSVLTYTGVQSYGIPAMTIADFTTSSTSAGQLSYNWMDLVNNPATIADGGTVFEVCFDVAGTAGSFTSIGVSNSPTFINIQRAPTVGGTMPITLQPNVNGGTFSIPGNPPMNETLILNLHTVMGDNGDNICLPITVENFTNISSIDGTVAWNPSVLSFTGAQNFGIATFNPNSGIQPSVGNITFSWFDNSGVTPETIGDGGILMELCFDIIGADGTSTVLEFADIPTELSASMAGATPQDPVEDIEVQGNSGTLTVSGTPPSGDVLILNLPAVSGDSGDNICIPVTVENFTNISSIDGTVAWNPSVLSFTGAQNFGIATFNPNSGIQPSVGNITFSWFDNSGVTPETIGDGGILMELCFDIIGADGTSTVLEFADIPTELSASMAGATPQDPVEDIEVQGNSGSVTVAGITPPEGDEVIFTIPDVCVEPNESEVCVPFIVTNFDMIASLDGTFTWDPTILRYTGLDNVELTGFSSGFLNTGNITDGQMAIAWFDNTGGSLPTTVADGEAVFEICFEVLGVLDDLSPLNFGNEITEISVSSSPTPLDPVMELPFIVNNGSVVICEKVDTEFVITIPNIDSDGPGEQVCVDFLVDGFVDLITTGFDITWDAAALANATITNINPGTSLTMSAFNLNGSNLLTLAWVDPSQQGNTLPDGSTFFTLCFDNMLACGQSATITILDDPNDVDDFTVLNEDLDVVASDISNGSVTSTCPTPVMPIVTLVASTDPLCNNQSDGSLSVNITGGTPPYTCVWSGGINRTEVVSGSCGLTGITAGTYNLLVTDSNNVSAAQVSYTLSNPSPVAINAVVTNTTCTTNGRIDVDPSGGTAPYTVVSNPADLSQLGPGVYPVEVRDANGCTTNGFFEVINGCVSTPITVGIVVTPANCGIGGKIDRTCFGGVGPPYSTTITPSISDVNNVPPGTYTVTCTDTQGNAGTATAIVSDIQPAPMMIQITQGNLPDCNGGGSVEISHTGGCEPVACRVAMFDINGNKGAQFLCDQTDNLAPGRYCVTLRDNLGNIQEATFVIDEPNVEPLEIEIITVSPQCPSDLLGTVEIKPTGGCENYTCSIDGVPVDCDSIVSQSPGMHDVLVSSSGFNTISESFIIEEAPLAATINTNDTTIVNCVLTATIIGTDISGYIWLDSDGDTLGSATGSTATLDLNDRQQPVEETFTLIITYDNGCSNTEITLPVSHNCDIVVTPLTAGDLRTNPEVPQTPCAGTDNCMGEILGTIQQNIPQEPYVIEVSNSIGESFSVTIDEAGPFTITSLCADRYMIAITDSRGTKVNIGVPLDINAPDPILIALDSMICDTTTMVPTGALFTTVTGGVAPYTVSWTDGSAMEVGDRLALENVTAGTYLINVLDGNDCEASAFYDVVECVDTLPPSTLDCESISVMTPNNDGMNDAFILDCANGVGNKLGLYDRWGRLIYEEINYTSGNWSGVDMDNQNVTEGTYFWVLEQERDNAPTEIHKGTVTILRR